LISGIAGIALTVAWLFRKIKGLWLWSLLVAAFSVLVVLSVDFAFNELLEDRHRNRINILLGKAEDPKGIGYNTNQSLIAIGSGGLYGKGYLQGTQTKFDFVPEQTTDFIFCTVGEEWGFLGSATVVLLFVILLFRLVFLAERQRSRFSRIYGYSVASILFLHFAVNIAMTVGLAPVIGIPLPFFSYGGSSLWGFTLLLFIFLRLDAYRLLVL
jgi:rod shape determining protein RodA